MEKKKYFERCRVCGKDVVGFSEKHAKQNLYIHEQTSDRHKQIQRIRYNKETSGELEYKGVIIAELPQILYSESEVEVGCLAPNEPLDKLPKHKELVGVFVGAKIKRSALTELKNKENQDSLWLFAMLERGFDVVLHLKDGKKLVKFKNVSIDIPFTSKTDFSKGFPKLVDFYWNDMRENNVKT